MIRTPRRRTINRVALAAALLPALGGRTAPGIEYTVQQTQNYVASLQGNPLVSPTLSALGYDYNADSIPDSGVGTFAIGRTPGTAGGGYTWTQPGTSTPTNVPAQDLYAFRISDPSFTTPKTKVVIAGGQHADESQSLYTLQGMVDFVLGSDPAAVSLRQYADFYVYPQTNPEGRWAPGAGKTNTNGTAFDPEHPTQDMNRFWNDPDTPTGPNNRPWSGIQVLRPAMRADTGAAGVGYVFDVHAPGTETTQYFWASDAMTKAPFASAAKHVGTMQVKEEAGEPGMLRNWSAAPAASGGLGATYTYTPEIGRVTGDTAAGYAKYGQDIARALNIALSTQPEPDTAPPAGTSFLVDFNRRLDTNSLAWNKVGGADRGTEVPLSDTNGKVWSATMRLPSAFEDSAAGDGWKQPNQLPAWAPTNAVDDYSFGTSTSDLVLTGLGGGRVYDVELVIARSLARPTAVSINGVLVNWNDSTQGYNAGQTILFDDVLTGADGTLSIHFDISHPDNRTSWAINALRVTAVPEPAAVGMLGVAGLLLLRRRRRAAGLPN